LNFGTQVDIAGLITLANFCDSHFMGFRVLPFFVGLAGYPYNSVSTTVLHCDFNVGYSSGNIRIDCCCLISVRSDVMFDCMTQILESLLPARCAADVPRGANAEEVRLCEFPAGHDDDRGEAHSEDSDSDEDTDKRRRIRCAHQ